MAQLNESIIIIKISKLTKDSEVFGELVNDDDVSNLEAVLEELINDPKALIEIAVTNTAE